MPILVLLSQNAQSDEKVILSRCTMANQLVTLESQRDPAGQSEFFVPVSYLQTFNRVKRIAGHLRVCVQRSNADKFKYVGCHGHNLNTDRKRRLFKFRKKSRRKDFDPVCCQRHIKMAISIMM